MSEKGVRITNRLQRSNRSVPDKLQDVEVPKLPRQGAPPNLDEDGVRYLKNGDLLALHAYVHNQKEMGRKLDPDYIEEGMEVVSQGHEYQVEGNGVVSGDRGDLERDSPLPSDSGESEEEPGEEEGMLYR